MILHRSVLHDSSEGQGKDIENPTRDEVLSAIGAVLAVTEGPQTDNPLAFVILADGTYGPSRAYGPGLIQMVADEFGWIVEYRDKNGPFKRIEDLMNVRGIGEKKFQQLEGLVTVGAAPKAVKKPKENGY